MSPLDLIGERGLANAKSIASGGSKAHHADGAELAITYLSASREPSVRPPAEKLGARIPIILTHCTDTVFARLVSCAVTRIAARRGDRATP